MPESFLYSIWPKKKGNATFQTNDLPDTLETSNFTRVEHFNAIICT